ncbi:MAG: 16S rRNA (cytosine(1402)-N(4))-methyltransferase RsmH, partial [Parcubacteria group bacterium]|nr:16S rRNA (cytosine(1402)-N(4))-methyltransferase RsmH [Parcubacteria group bacterium]
MVIHVPVLLHEVIKYLDPKPGEDFIDATAGDGGHARAILERIGSSGRLLGIDWDGVCLTEVRLRRDEEGPRCDTGSMVREPEPPRTGPLKQRDRSGIAFRPLESGRFDLPGRSNLQLVLKQGNFADIVEIAHRAGFKSVSGVLFDLGLRSGQIDEPERGFSYLKDGPLDMRFRTRTDADYTRTHAEGLTAAEIVNKWSEEKLARIFKIYGEERNAKKVARVIAAARQHGAITTTTGLVGILDKVHKSYKFYSRIFQALRIAVNNELENLDNGLAGAWSLLEPQGRLAVISFHSLEDRIVKNFFKDRAQAGEGKILTPKPIRPSQTEMSDNPRSRSAKLRALVKIS